MKVTRRRFINQFSLLAVPSVAIPWYIKDTRNIVNLGPAETGYTILFQGDSITDGNRGRTDDPNHIMGHGYAFSVASRLGADYPDRNLKFINKGISGNTVSDLNARWQEDALHLRPDLISVLIGVNDVLFELRNKGASSTEKFEAELDKLLTITHKELPNTLFVLGEPFVLPVGMVKADLDKWTAAIQQRQRIVKKLSKEFNTAFVGYQQVFQDACKNAPPDYWIWDGIHPTVPGHELMAREWIRTVGERLPLITPK